MLKSNVVWDLYQDSKEEVWIATNQGINFYNPITKKIEVEDALDKCSTYEGEKEYIKRRDQQKILQALGKK